jgi:23S rRNA pseudouridine1911/1915/1917 synthase
MELRLDPFTVIVPESGHTLAKVLRSRLHADRPSWARVKSLIESRRVKVNGGIVIDPVRRLDEGDRIELLNRPDKAIAVEQGIVIVHIDDHIVVVEKPSGVSSVRHPAELDWPEEKRRLDPTLQDLTQWQIAKQLNRPHRSLPPLRIVHRLDRDTSGLLVFTRSVAAERSLGQQFRHHTVLRRYLALVPGTFRCRTITSTLIRDRGDGRRGSTRQPDTTGKSATTHITVEASYATATLVSCRLETGRTHQIRIHLAEAGHPVAGESVYTRTVSGLQLPVLAGAPRLFLHAIDLGFQHPITQQQMTWTLPLPADLSRYLLTFHDRK